MVRLFNSKNFNLDSLESLLHEILHHLRDITHAEAGTIYLTEENYLKFYVFQNDTFQDEKLVKLHKPFQKLKFKIEENSTTLAVQSFVSNKIIMVDDIYCEPGFNFQSSKDFDAKFDYKTHSILTAPLPLQNLHTGAIIGVVQLINKKKKNTYLPFTQSDKEFIELSGYLMALSIVSEQNNIKELKKVSLELEAKVMQRTKKLEDKQKKLIEQAHEDPMTGLYNRRYLNEIGESLLLIAKRAHASLSVMILDIDDFKSINDSCGHAVGDSVIKSVSSVVLNSVRKSDICARLGGDEFVVLLPNTPANSAKKIAEKIRKMVEENKVVANGATNINCTISLGVTEVLFADETIDQVIKRADDSLYQAKKLGKNQVVSPE